MARYVLLLIGVACLHLAWAGPVRCERDVDRPPEQPDPVYWSPVDIRVSEDGRRAYVVNQTSDCVAIIDCRTREVVGQVPVGSHPSQAALSPDGRTLYVTCRYGTSVDVVDLGRNCVVRSIPTGYEPYGLAVSADGERLYVANSMSNSVSVINARTGQTLHEVPVGRDPRYVALTPDGSRLVVANGLSRDVSIVEVATGRVTETRSLEDSSVLRQIACSPDGKWAFVAHVVSHDELMTLQMERGFIHSNGFTVLDLRSPGRDVTLLLDRLLDGAANPWGVACSSDGRRLYVSLTGVHEVAIVDIAGALKLLADRGPDAAADLRRDTEVLHKRKIALRVDAGGIGPRGLALNETTGELLVCNYFSETVSVLDAITGEIRAIIPVGPRHEMTLRRKGEMLANDGRLCFQRWFSCGSCHQEDGTIDGLNWDLANDGLGNPKNAKSLLDVHDTPPAMWQGVRENMDEAVAAGERFGGFIPDPENHRALMAFFGSPRRAPNPYRGRNPEAAARGKQVFQRARCHACHPEPRFTDLKKHDLGLAGTTDLRSRFDTPSLRECYRTGPYLHDGKARTLREIFTVHNPDDLHGRTSNLSEEELEDLLEFLRCL